MFWMNIPAQKKILLVISLLIIASLACSLPFGEGSGDAEEFGTPNDDNTEINLRCTEMGYPCTFAEAPRDKVERGLDLMDLADEVFSQEGNTIAVAERLLEETDIAEIYYDERGVWYRVEGAPPLIFLHPEAFTYGLENESDLEQTHLTSNVLFSPHQPSGDGPIGENPPGEKVQKKALFVNPVVWQFGSSVFDAARSQLLEYRDYKCADCLEYFRGDIKAYDLIDEEIQSAGPSYEQFLGWKDYDLIHVFAHGYQFCPGTSVTSSGQPVVSGDRETFPENTAGVVEGTNLDEGECVTMIQTGHYQTRDYLLENPRDIPGIAWIHKPGDDIWAEVVTTDFFRSKYPGGLDDAILFFTSCQLMKDESLANTLKGTNTAVFGWTQTVTGSRGKATVKDFFTELIDNGLRASVAYEKTIQSESHTEHSEDWHGAELKMVLDQGSDPRGREVVIMIQPIFRELLEENDALPVDGVAGDGEDDELFILIQVDGVDEDQDIEDFEIHLAMDGEELSKTFKPSEKVGDYSYRAFEIISLPFDAADRDFVELEAWVDLPEGGDTRHFLENIEIAGCGWIGTLSGNKSGELKGEIVYPSTNITTANVEALTLLANQGAFGPGEGSGMPSAAEFANLPFNAMLGNRAQFPFMMLIPGQAATVMLDSSSFGAGNDVSFDLRENSEERFEGSFSASVTDMASQSGYSVAGEMIWHVDSLCSLDVILELAANPLPANLVP
jgi:hypothetical protein